jgi:hypothetical protein
MGCNQIARRVSEDAISYLAKHPHTPHTPTVEVGVNENQVTLRKKTTSHMLEITCTGLETFKATIDGVIQPKATSKSGMARAVLHWLNPKH